MRSIALWYTAVMLLVGAIATVAVLWCHFSHLHQHQGPILVSLTSRHGIHVSDIVVVSIELVLLLSLSVTLLRGATRSR